MYACRERNMREKKRKEKKIYTNSPVVKSQDFNATRMSINERSAFIFPTI